MKLKVGDEVICIESYGLVIKGDKGFIKDIINGAFNLPYGIEFKRDIGGHNCSGKCKNKHGYYLNRHHLKLSFTSWKERYKN